MIKKTYISILMFTLTLCVHAQDAHLSQFYNAKMTMNPAETGMFNGDYRAHLQYRNQWSSVTSNPFVTSLVSFEKPYNKFGFGILIMNSKAGISNLNVTNATLSAAYEVTNDPSGNHHLTTGIQIGLIQKHIKPDDLVYNNQYSGSNGVTYDASLPSYENFASQNFVLPDLNFGIKYENTSEENKVKPYIGISAFHLTTPKESYLESENKLPIRMVSTIGAKIDLEDNNYISPNLLLMKQGNVYEFNIGFLWNKYMKDSDMHLFVGPYFRNKDAIVTHAGILYKNYSLGLSYDFNISTLSTASHYKGGFEISLIYKPALGMLVPSIY